MKKISTLLSAVLLTGLSAFADNTYTLTLNTTGNNSNTLSAVQSDDDDEVDSYFSYSSKFNGNAKYAGAVYNGMSFFGGLKMESSTSISFTTTRTSTVTIVQSLATAYATLPKLALGSDAVSASSVIAYSDNSKITDAKADTSIFQEVKIYTYEGCAAGSYTISRASSELGLVFVSVTEIGDKIAKLSSPVISYDEKTGSVSISKPDNASSVVYTTDGSAPSSTNGSTYSDAFVVADATVVKAIALGDGVSYSNSDVAQETVLLANVACDEPTATVKNGTVAFECATSGASIMVSTDNSSFSLYSQPLTFFSDTKIYAKAVREGASDSDVAEFSVAAAPALSSSPKSVSTVLYYGYSSSSSIFEQISDGTTAYGIKGVSGSSYDGWSVALAANSTGTYDKSLSGADKISVDGTSYLALKGSNGRKMTISLPDYYTAYRLTVYSYTAAGNDGESTTWKINDVEQDMVALTGSDVSNASSPDVRVFSLDNLSGSFTLTNSGRQQCMVIVVDCIYEAPTAAPAVASANAEIVSVEYFTLTGAKVAAPVRGINIVKTTYADGSSKAVKIIK